MLLPNSAFFIFGIMLLSCFNNDCDCYSQQDETFIIALKIQYFFPLLIKLAKVMKVPLKTLIDS